MAQYSVAEAKNRLTALIAAAERGEAVTITRHGKPVVEIKALDPAMAHRPMSPAESMAWLERELAKLDLPPMEIDGATLVRQMRDEDDH
ncbi:MAG: type II toxin-antitoxin system prevent-host-death family antitoxin [Acetobacteraceae bacterium]|nr:type II toxin-antitoxin system prevent-host-death family antitoxin [Acetobacteraceae bacterium]